MDIKGWPGPEDEGGEDGPARKTPPSVKPWSQDIECSDSICGHEAFQQALQDCFRWRTARSQFPIRVFEDEMDPEYRLLERAESASRDALVSVIDAYCAYRCARVFIPDED